jgi:ribosomal-protein-alanine N-acetyltransferase
MGLGGIVKGKRTVLRTPVEADLAAYNRWMADMRVRHLVRPWKEPAMPATWKERLTEENKEKNGALWSVEAGGALVGSIQVGFGWEPHRDGAQISSFVIDPEHWRKGYGADAALALHRFLFDYTDLRRVSVSFTDENAAAKRIVERLGYVAVAGKHQVHYRDGAYVDESEYVLFHDAWNERFGGEREYAPLGEA